MRERPIPYSAPMVRARRAGLKTMTRRMVNPQPDGFPGFRCIGGDGWLWETPQGCRIRCPYGLSGDVLWVREAWRTLAEFDHLPPRDIPQSAPIWYEADGPAPEQFAGGRYRHARFMPRWVSRGLDEIVGIRVERLQDITGVDAQAEGCPYNDVDGAAREWYCDLWESINGPGSWDANPWVWVVEFRQVTP